MGTETEGKLQKKYVFPYMLSQQFEKSYTWEQNFPRTEKL